jgi:hypothetical protein
VTLEKNKYRIKIETEASGKKWYYVQERVMFVFWQYLTEVRDMSICAHRIGWRTIGDAEKHIQKEIEHRKKLREKKIVKSEIYKLK